MSAPKLNVKLLRKIQKHILQEPKRYDQNVWFERKNPQHDPSFAPCGTMACIGGWAQSLSSKRGLVEPSFDKARRLLGLECDQAARLLDSVSQSYCAWPAKFSKAYLKAKTRAGKARVAVRRIDHFIATKGAE